MNNLKNIKELNPNRIYPYINFNHVKKQLSSLFNDYLDYGSVFLIKNKNFALSINEIGKITLFYERYDEDIFNEAIDSIEKTFKQQINEFKLQT